MQIVPPFGYAEVLPLQRNQRVRLLPAGEVPDFARRLNAIPLSLAEFVPAIRNYPIVFSSGDNGKTFTCVAVLGLAAGERRYVTEIRPESNVVVVGDLDDLAATTTAVYIETAVRLAAMPEQLGALLKSEMARYATIAEAAKLPKE